MTYDPRAHGARCDDCSLKHCRPVPPEMPEEPGTLAIVGEAPGEEEEKQSRPFCGPSGRELDAALRAARIDRRAVLTTNVLLCRPEKNKLDVHLRKLKKQDDDRHKRAMEKWKAAGSLGEPPRLTRSPTPMECCKPRFEAEIKGYTDFITLGKIGTNAVTGLDGGILPVRGGVMELDPQVNINGEIVRPARRVMPTVHPAFVLRTPRWRHVFKADILKAARHFRGESKWAEPRIVYHPSPSQLEEFLFGGYGPYGCDVETDGIESLTAKLRCITIAAVMPDGTGLVHCVGVESIDKSFRYYPDFVWRKIVELLKRFFGDPGIAKTGHNFNSYDKLVLRNQLGIELANVTDGMILHKNVESELPHGLGYVGKLLTDVPEWKSDRESQKLSTHAASNEVLHKYGALDAYVSRLILPPLVEQVVLRDQVEVFHIDTQMQEICVEMHQNGMYVDQARRLKEERALLGRRHETLTQIRSFLQRPDFNPGSVQQLRELLFEDWGLVADLQDKDRLTESDDPSTGDLVLRTLLTQPGVPKDKRDFIKVLRRFRKIQKVLGTYVTKLRFDTELLDDDLGWDEDEDWIDIETRKRYGTARAGITFPHSGRMHPGYNVQAVTGRLSSSKPMNCYDEETELLTRDGWVKFPDLSRSVEVAQWQAGVISFVRPSAYHEGESDKMIYIENRANDLCVTPNHRLLFSNDNKRVETAQDLLNRSCHSDWTVGLHSVHAGSYSGPGLRFAGKLLSGNEIRFLAAVQADGSWVWANHKRYGLDFSFSKERKQARFRELCTALAVTWTEKVRPAKKVRYKGEDKERIAKGSIRFYVNKPPAFLDLLGAAKSWGKWVLDMNKAQLDALVDEVWKWDGCITRGSQYASAEKQNADWISIALTLAGVSNKTRFYTNAGGNSVWVVDVRAGSTAGFSRLSKVYSKIERKKVYCVTVPSGYVVVRRNGKVTVSANSQNFPKGLRAMVVAAPGNVLVGADADQLELRVAAAHWGVEMYLRAFADGKDPHSMTAFAIFGEEFCNAAGIHPSAFSRPGKLVGTCYKDGAFDGVNPDAMQMRNLSKAVQYASQYMGSVETVHQLIQKTEQPERDPLTGKPREDGTTILPYALEPLSKTRDMREKWLANAFQFQTGWEKEIAEYQALGYLKDPVHGRRRDFLDGEDPNQIVNYKIQCSASSLMNNAIISLYSEVQERRKKKNWGPHCGIINQCHDSIVLEVPEAEAEWAAATLARCMNQTHPKLPGVVFSAGAKIGKTWKEVG